MTNREKDDRNERQPGGGSQPGERPDPRRTREGDDEQGGDRTNRPGQPTPQTPQTD